MATLIKGGTLVTAEKSFPADILVEGGKISQIGLNLQVAEANVVDASGRMIFPGGVDPHVHLDLPMFGTVSSDDHYTGTKAAAFGGTTTVLDFVSFDFPTLGECVENWQVKAEKAAVDYSAHMNLSRFDEKIAAEIPSLREMGITTLKVFTAYNGRLRLEDGNIFKALRIAGENGMLGMLHAENGDVIETLTVEALAAGHISPEWHARTRPAWGAVESALRAFALAAQAKAPLYLVHMNTAGEVDMLQYARQHGVKAMGETCPQYLFFTEDDLRRPDGAKWICSPPMRTSVDNVRLWEGVSSDIIQTIGTDHCPFFYDGTKPILFEGKLVAIPGKELGRDDFTKIPNGLPGVEDRLAILWTTGVGSGKMTASQFVALTSTNPAKIFGLYPRKGAIAVGSDADLVVYDPAGTRILSALTHHQAVDRNIYEGMQVKGRIAATVAAGRVRYQDGDLRAERGAGRYLKRG